MSGAPRLVLGVDVGTSGVRAVAATADTLSVRAEAAVPMAAPLREGPRVQQDPRVWAAAFDDCLAALRPQVDFARVAAIAIDATSGTVLVTDAAGLPLAPALLYNDAHAHEAGARLDAVAPADGAARGAANGLARALQLLEDTRSAPVAHVLHQADWLAGRLLGRHGVSDENNALKTGYDPQARQWPAWLDKLQPAGLPPLRSALLPRVQAPGSVFGPVAAAVAAHWGWPADAVVVAGSTDGVAAFLATGAAQEGDGVTSLGSTLVVKQLSRTPIVSARDGIYSHRLGELWLPGGASNAGGAALLQHFSAARMAELEPRLRPDTPTGLDYYPLPAPGERFPVHDPAMAPRLSPRPGDDARFLQGLLEGLAGVEALAYERLRALGGPALRSLRSVGGGAANAAFTRIRQRRLGVPFLPSAHTQAAAGAARLAADGWARQVAQG
jgi:sugar (pentulose or hexulose) kinase